MRKAKAQPYPSRSVTPRHEEGGEDAGNLQALQKSGKKIGKAKKQRKQKKELSKRLIVHSFIVLPSRLNPAQPAPYRSAATRFRPSRLAE